jgi:ATP-dependent Lon protease
LVELEQAEQDPDLIALSRQFKATAMELISVLEQVNNSMKLDVLFLLFDFKIWCL